MIDRIDIARVLFLDIETATEHPNYDNLSEELQALWRIKCRQITRLPDEELDEVLVADLYPEKAGIFAEFAQVICVSVGVLHRDRSDNRLRVRLKSLADPSEKKLLEAFSELLQQYYPDPNQFFLCGHNIKEFDIPFLCRRMVVHQLPFPQLLDIAGKKPWETKHLLDTMDYWKFGDRKNFTSLRLLAALLNFPSPKAELDGSKVGEAYWSGDQMEKITRYCELDVLATIQLFLRYQRRPILEEDQVTHVDAE